MEKQRERGREKKTFCYFIRCGLISPFSYCGATQKEHFSLPSAPKMHTISFLKSTQKIFKEIGNENLLTLIRPGFFSYGPDRGQGETVSPPEVIPLLPPEGSCQVSQNF